MSEIKNLFGRACAGMTARDWRNQWWAVGWLFAWQLAFLAATHAFRAEWVAPGAAAIVVAILPTLLGVATLLAYKRFLDQSDELQRKIQLSGMAFGFGCGLVLLIGLRLLERAGFAFGVDLADGAALMMIAFAVGVVLGARRYA